LANWNLYETRIKINGNTEKDIQINTIKSSILNDFASSPSYVVALRNGNEQGFNILEESVLSTNSNKKKIVCKPNENIFVGDIITFDNSDWICIENDSNSEMYDIGIISRSNNTLSFYDSNSILYSIPCIVGDKITLKTDENKYLTTVSNELYLTVSDNSTTQQIKINEIYRLGRYNYQIMSLPNDLSILGLLIFKLQYSETEQHIPSYSVEILNGTTTNLQVGDTLQLNVVCKVDNVPLSPTPTVSFVSSNVAKCTVNSSGLVTAIATGSCTITVVSNGVSDSISLTVVAEEQHNLTVDISGSISIIKNNSSTYTCVFKDNGIPITDTSVFYLTADDGVSATTLAGITSQDGVANSCVVKGLNLGYAKLFVKDVGESVVSSGFRIQIKNLF